MLDNRLTLSGEKFSSDLAHQVCGVGLLRSEYLLRYLGSNFCSRSVCTKVAEYVDLVASIAAPQPVWYRLADLWSDEANPLIGTRTIVIETNPLVGLRGIRRGLEDQVIFEDELSLIVDLARTHRNLHVLTPFVADATQFAAVVQILEKLGWPNRVGTMIEIPSAVLDIEAFIQEGATNLLVGLNDLTSLLLGAERSSCYYSKNHPAVVCMLRMVAKAVAKRVEWGIGGELDSSIIETAEKEGADYVSVPYYQANCLLGIPKNILPELEFVSDVRKITRQRSQEFARSQVRSSS
ncbi:putative PEP-binding protein [Photobacterium sp. 53610]|uniref:putative PEP-binding protein n=1 Tax=Photobacterium sp. 53610 TaxID=3102789 RepID=UPI002ED84D90